MPHDGSEVSQATVELGSQYFFLFGKARRPPECAIERLMREADDAVDEIAEQRRRGPCSRPYESADVEVGVRRLGSVCDQPPAPEVRRQFLQCLIGEYSAPSARAEFASVISQPVKSLDHVDGLPWLAGSNQVAGKSLTCETARYPCRGNWMYLTLSASSHHWRQSRLD